MTEPIKTEDTIAPEATPDNPPAEATEEAPADMVEAGSMDAPVETPAAPEKSVPDEVQQERLDRMRRKQKSVKVPHLEHDPTLLPNMSLSEVDAELERELEEAMGGLSEEQMYGDLSPRGNRKASPEEEQPKRKKGKIISIHGADVFVDVPGSRSQGVLPITQFPEGKPEIGAEFDVDIEGYDNANGLLILTRKGASVDADWSTVQTGMIVEARVIETNKGGLTVDVNGIRGFMPISQIDLYRVENAEQFVNERLRCEITEVKPDERNLVVSRRALLEREREELREKLWGGLAEGQICDGVVRKVENFGAFVDIGGVDGLLHVSEMSWMRVNHPQDVVQPGQSLKVIILKIDRERQRIGLGLKQLLGSPWDDVQEKYPLGSTISGKVTRLAQFGAFVELEPGIEGLVHISELAHHRIQSAADVVQTGQEVNVQVLLVDTERKRISLSVKAAQARDVADAEEDEEVDEAPARPARPRTTPLRGGVGNQQWFDAPADKNNE